MGGIGSKMIFKIAYERFLNFKLLLIFSLRLDESLHVVNEPMQYPRRISTNWGLLNRIQIDTAIQLGGITYFFDGTMFYEFEDPRMKLKIHEPKLSSIKWMNCNLTMTKEEGMEESFFQHQLANGAKNTKYTVNKFLTFFVFVWLLYL